MISILTFMWGITNFSLLWLVIHFFLKTDWRNSFVSTSLFFGIITWFMAELLSLFGELNLQGVMCASICYTIILSILFFSKCRKLDIDFQKITLFLKTHKSIWFLILIAVITFFIAIVYPPSNWDSMTYHLPRIEHWLQNGNLNHYYTNNDRQLHSSPFAEICILYGRAISGDDWLMNSVQWFSFIGILIVISKIAWRFGLNVQMQIVAALFFATLPIAIIEATSTQNDLVVAFWLLCLLDRLLAWQKDKKISLALQFGAALGLAILTKGTAYPIALPIVIYFAFICIKQYKKCLLAAICAGMLCLLINMPNYVRNYNTFQKPIEAHSATVSPFTLQSFFYSSFSNVYINVPVLLPGAGTINNKLKNVDKDIYPYGPIYIFSVKDWKNMINSTLMFHEDNVRSPFHILLIIASLIFLLRRKREPIYIWLVIACGCVFSFCIPWQPWIMRLQLPLFALATPAFALAFNDWKNAKVKYSILTFICVFSLLPLLMNYTRPILALSINIKGVGVQRQSLSIWKDSREKLVFVNRRDLYLDYKKSCEAFLKSGDSQLGLIIGGDTWEYPIWRYLRASDQQTFITHQRLNAIDESIECLFILNSVEFNKENAIEPEEDNIKLLGRDKTDNSKWGTIYP